MLKVNGKLSVAICETQPVTAEGIRVLLSRCDILECQWSVPSLPVAVQLNKQRPVRALLIDKAFGPAAVTSALTELRAATPETGLVVWGHSLTESDALGLLQAGVRGILRKSSDVFQLISCLRGVAGGATWVSDTIFHDNDPALRSGRSELTSREDQVLKLVERGLKNREIAIELGICSGTVKIHLKHIFEKTGVHGRYGLALNGMRERHTSEKPLEVEFSQSA